MVYSNKLVAVIKYNGKILREKDDNIVYLPFLAEYQIFIKNLNNVDAVINISIDGKDVLDNQSLVVKANSQFSLDGFLNKNKVSNKFRFIQKTNKIQEHRQDNIDDGIVRIEYRFAKQDLFKLNVSYSKEVHHYHHHHLCNCPTCFANRNYQPMTYYYTTGPFYGPIGGSGSLSSGTTLTDNSYYSNCTLSNSPVKGVSASNNGVQNCSSINNIQSSINSSPAPEFNPFVPTFDEGITVKGSESNQRFQEVHISDLEDISQVIIIKLKGYKGSERVEKPLLVNSKVKCSTCGRKSKSHMKFCPECGTALF